MGKHETKTAFQKYSSPNSHALQNLPNEKVDYTNQSKSTNIFLFTIFPKIILILVFSLMFLTLLFAVTTETGSHPTHFSHFPIVVKFRRKFPVVVEPVLGPLETEGFVSELFLEAGTSLFENGTYCLEEDPGLF